MNDERRGKCLNKKVQRFFLQWNSCNDINSTLIVNKKLSVSKYFTLSSSFFFSTSYSGTELYVLSATWL